MTQEAKKEEVGYVINFAANLGNDQQLSVSGNLPKGATLELMNVEFDKLRSAFNRQQARSAAIGAGQEIERLVLRQKDAIDDLEKVNARADAKGGLSVQERQQRELAVSTVERMAKDIEYKRGVHKQLLEESK
jgi:hypothetical protein